MRFEAATIKDIAKALGLSPSTISRALRDSYEISGETKELVLEYAKQINYQPNPIALSLREKKSCSIGVVVADVGNSFHSQVVHGIESMAHQYGYNVIIAQTRDSYAQEVSTMKFLASRSVDGCIVSVAAETDEFGHFSKLYDKGFPLVFFGRVAENVNTYKVLSDVTEGAYNATLHLLQNGFRRIAVLATSPQLAATRQKLAGYANALQHYGLPFDEALIKYCKHNGQFYIDAASALDEFFLLNNKPDAIITFSDELTTAFIQYSQLHQLTIPEDLEVVAFCDFDLTGLLSPSISVVRQPAFEMGKTAAEFLIKMIEAKRPITQFETRILPAELIIRGSNIQKGAVPIDRFTQEFA